MQQNVVSFGRMRSIYSGHYEDAMELSPAHNLYVNFPKDRARVDDLWERFHSARALDRKAISDPYGSLLLADWTRCKAMGVDPRMRRVPVLSDVEFQQLTKARRFLLESATPILEKIRQAFIEIPGLILFADHEGVLLQVLGDSRMKLRAADRCNITEGARWDESSAGTNGIGTPIAKRVPVHVCASEHYCEAWHMWTCAGAPILDPFTGEVIGVIDFTTHERDYRESAIVLSYSLAVNITSELRCKRELERLHLLHQHDLCTSRFPHDEVVAFDRMGNIVRSSSLAASKSAGGAPVGRVPAEDLSAVREVCLPGSDEPIGKLIVRPKRRTAGSIHQGRRGDTATASFGSFLTCDPETKQLMERIGKVASSDLGILLVGETGTGKEVIAQYVHAESKRRGGPYVGVNCGAINKELFESTFFGYERGAFTGADTRGRKGLFESANGGTLFLDEIGEMPLDIQAGLLRVLETGTFRRVGSDRELSTNCRIIAATNRPLAEEIAKGCFRSDLYYRLSVVKFDVPPLRGRPWDIPVLADHFLTTTCRKHGFPAKKITPEALDALAEYGWPGNVRELRNVVESASVFSNDVIHRRDLPPEINKGRPQELPDDSPPSPSNIAEVWDAEATSVSSYEGARSGQPPPRATRDAAGRLPFDGGSTATGHHRSRSPEDETTLIVEALRTHKTAVRVAKALGISRATLYRKFEALGIDPHAARRAGVRAR